MPNNNVPNTSTDSKAWLPFAELRPETNDALVAMRQLVRYGAGQIVTHEAEDSSFIGLVASGVLRMQKTLVDGRHPIVGLLVEGDIFGRVFDGATELAIEAATDADVYTFPRAPFEALLKRSPDLDRAVLLNILNELDRARDWMVILSNQKIVNRVAGFLLVMCTRFMGVDHLVQASQTGIEIKIPVGRTDLAHLLGTRQESISRALHALADAGDIDILQSDRILVRNVNALASKAGEEDRHTIATLKDLFDPKSPQSLDRKGATRLFAFNIAA